MRYPGLWLLGWCVGIGLMLSSALVAAELNPSGWKFTGPNATAMAKAIDNNLDTRWESDGPQAPGLAMTIDLGKSVYVYRVFLTPGREVTKFPRSLNVYVGESPDTLKLVAKEQSLSKPDATASGWDFPTLRNESCLQFPAVKGRFVKLEIGQNGAGFPWAIAEMDIHAATRDVAPAQRMAVVVDRQFLRSADGKPVSFNPMKLAAEDLQYYLMELTDTPVDIVATDEAVDHAALHIKLVTPPQEQVPSPEPDPKNLEDVSITRKDGEVCISGLTQRAVLFGAYEFLASQGVRWLYPDLHGDWVPARKKLDLSILPISYHPPFSVRGFIGPGVVGMSTEQFNLFQVRHAFNLKSGLDLPLGTVPRMNCGFGWAHTMGGLFDEESLKAAHPDWWPGPYRQGWYQVPCTSNPEVLEHIRQKIEETIQQRVKDKLPPLQGFSVHPNDSPCFCECDRCTQLFGKPVRVDPDGAEESTGTWGYSDNHFYLINELAKRLQQDHPELFLKTLAYANHERPPLKIDRLPDNVLVDICPWWSPLPVDAAKNAAIRDNLKAWQSRCRSIGIWSYVLIYSDTTFGNPAGEKNLVIPNVRALLDQNRLYRELGFRQVSTQLYGPQNHWPWALYAFTQSTWHPEETEDTLLQDFFHGYYGEAWQPMLQWYTLLAQTALANNIDTSMPDPRLFAGDKLTRLRSLLRQAEQKARKWYVKERVAQARYDTEWTATKAQWKTTVDRPYPCYRFKQAPEIDGTLDDPIWRTAPELSGFNIVATRVNREQPGRLVMQNPTRFRMGWDDKFLYLGMVCQEPESAKTKERDALDTKFEYRNLVEIFFAPETPYYRQILVSSAGYIWGPLKIRQVNAHQVMQDPNFACKTAHTAEGWTLEARFPLAMLASVPPAEGTCWPANFVRVAEKGRDIGEQFSSWSEIPRYNFHEYYLGAWSLIAFHGTALSETEAAKAGEALQAGYPQARQQYDLQRNQQAVFAQQVAGKTDLGAPSAEKGIARMGFEGGAAGRNRVFQVVWSKEPATFDAVRIVWGNRKVIRPWYSLEYWDGERYRLIDDRRNNNDDVSLHEFAPITASRLRLTLWPDLFGWTDVPSVKAIEVYKR